MACKYTYNGITFNQKLLVKYFYDELTSNPEKYPSISSLLLKAHTQAETLSILDKMDQSSRGFNKNNGYVSVTAYMDFKHRLASRGNIDPAYLLPVYDAKNRLKNSIKIQMKLTGGTEEEIEKDILFQMHDEKLGTFFGTYVHDFVEVGLIHGVDSTEFRSLRTDLAEKIAKKKVEDYKEEVVTTFEENKDKTLLDLLSENAPRTYSADEVMVVVEKRAKELIDSIHAEFPGAIPRTELSMATKNAVAPPELEASFGFRGVIGRADLVLVDPQGEVHIIDFKVANRAYKDWYAAKKFHTEYQLGLYRAILTNFGIDGDKIHLYVQPIYIERGNINSMRVEPIVNLLTPGENKFAHLDWKEGEFTANIRELINSPVHMDIDDVPASVAEILETFGNLVTYDPIKKNYSAEEFLKKVHPEMVNGKPMFKFVDWTRGDGKPVYKATKEEFVKPGGFLDEFNERLRKLTKQQTKAIADKLIKLQKKRAADKNYRIKEEDITFLEHKDASSDSAKMIQLTFTEYSHPHYEVLDVPALMELGILAFRNKITNVVNFVCITDQNLNGNVDVNGNATVLGNFVDNDEARHLSFEPMPAKCGYMEMLKTVHAINMLQEQGGYFSGLTVGTIEVVNLAWALKRPADMELLLENYEFLTRHQQLKNHFVEQDIEVGDYWDQLMAYVNKCLADEEFDPEIKQVLVKSKLDLVTKAKKLKFLKEAIEALKKKRAGFNWKSFNSSNGDSRTFDVNDPVQVVYVLLNEAYTYYLGIPIDYSGLICKWGLQFGEVIKLLQLPFIGNQTSMLPNGRKSVGILNGTEMSSPQTIPSQTLQALYQYYDIAFIKIRQEFQTRRKTIEKLTRDYIMKRKSGTNRFLWNDTTDIWRELLVKEPDGKTLSKSLMLRNPWEDKSLTSEQAEFLKAILWEINKYRMNLSDDLKELSYPQDADKIETELATNNALAESRVNGSYFYLPLRRASEFLRLKAIGRIGLTGWFEKKWDALQNDYDPRELHGSQIRMLNDQQHRTTDMFNQYLMSEQERQNLIEEQGVEDFEFDLDYLASDVLFQSVRQRCFEDVLLITDAVSTTMHFILQTTDLQFTEELDAMEDQSKVNTGRSPLPDELKEVTGVAGALKRLNSLMVLSCRPAQLFKELTYGQLTNYSRAWALKHTGSAVSAKSVFNANKVIWGLSLRKYGKAFAGEGDIADFTMCEAINKIYGIANEDLNRTVDNSTLQRTGLTHNFSRWMYIANSAPDYFNRMTLFIAKMMEDGCFEAHSLDADGNLVYDFTKDERFSEINKYGWDADRTDKKFLEQKALFRAMAQDFEREGYILITVVNGKEVIKPLPRAYTIKQRDSLKEVADLAYGFFDHEAKSLIDHKFFGLIWKQFMTFWTAKTTLWFRAKPTAEGSNTSQGKFVHMERNGEKIYREVIEEDGKLKVILRQESELTEEQKRTLEPQYEWKGEYVEGICYSIMGMLHDIFHADFKHLKEDKAQLANLKLALHDILMGWILYAILKFIFSGGSNKMLDVHPAARIMLRAMQDVGPQSIGSLSWEPGFISNLDTIQRDALSLFDTDQDTIDRITSHIGMFSDFKFTRDN